MVRSAQRFVVLVASSVLLTGCTGVPGSSTVPQSSVPHPETSGSSPDKMTDKVVVTRDSSPVGAPLSCRPEAAGLFISNYITAVNRGLMHDLDRYFANSSRFHWYSDATGSNIRIGTAANDRLSLLSYLESRHVHHEQVAIVQLAVAYRASDNSGNFEFNGKRVADDIAPEGSLTVGKGALDCETGKIMVWSWGESVAGQLAAICPAGSEGGLPLIACTQE